MHVSSSWDQKKRHVLDNTSEITLYSVESCNMLVVFIYFLCIQRLDIEFFCETGSQSFTAGKDLGLSIHFIFIWENEGPEALWNLFKITQLVENITGTRILFSWL